MVNLRAGKYLVELPGTQGFSTASTGTMQFFMKFNVLCIWSHEKGEWETIDPVERTWYRAITDKSAQYAAEDLRTLGFTGDKFSQLDPRHPQRQVLSGEVEMECHLETYNQREREKWDVVRSSTGEREEKTADASAIKKLDMLFGKALAGVPVPKAATTAKPATPAESHAAERNASAAVDDDDIPF